MKKIGIYEAVLVACDKIGNCEKGESNKSLLTTKTVEFRIEKTIDCVIDFEKKVAIELSTNKQYQIIQRDKNGKLKREELEKILQNKFVINTFYEKRMSDMSMIYKLFLEERARTVFNNYLKQLNPKKLSHHVKSLGTKKNKVGKV